MKKLSLKNLKLGADDMLQRNQLKTVFGGYSGSGTCEDDECSSDSGCTTEHPKCNDFNCTDDNGKSSKYKSCI